MDISINYTMLTTSSVIALRTSLCNSSGKGNNCTEKSQFAAVISNEHSNFSHKELASVGTLFTNVTVPTSMVDLSLTVIGLNKVYCTMITLLHPHLDTHTVNLPYATVFKVNVNS